MLFNDNWTCFPRGTKIAELLLNCTTARWWDGTELSHKSTKKLKIFNEWNNQTSVNISLFIFFPLWSHFFLHFSPITWEKPPPPHSGDGRFPLPERYFCPSVGPVRQELVMLNSCWKVVEKLGTLTTSTWFWFLLQRVLHKLWHNKSTSHSQSDGVRASYLKFRPEIFYFFLIWVCH